MLNDHGFTAENTIALVAVCRDEITRPFVDGVQQTWGEAFNLCSLAAMIFVGRTGFLAAEHHAPDLDGRQRYVFIAMPHIAISAAGTVGHCARAGQRAESTACGALVAFRKELQSGQVRVALDPGDLEYSLMKQRLLALLPRDEIPDLVRLTEVAHTAILADLEAMIARTVDPERADWAVLTGIQIHGPDNTLWVAHRELHAVIRGERRPPALG
jgi:hypothetical protein